MKDQQEWHDVTNLLGKDCVEIWREYISHVSFLDIFPICLLSQKSCEIGENQWTSWLCSILIQLWESNSLTTTLHCHFPPNHALKSILILCILFAEHLAFPNV